MIDIILTVNKEKVYEEVARTTSYTGAKMDDEFAYDRIFTTDEDKSMLERFWCESKNTICNSLKKMLLDETEADSEYRLSLGLSNSFDEALKESMQRSLFSFFVMNVTAKWYTFTNKEEAAGFSDRYGYFYSHTTGVGLLGENTSSARNRSSSFLLEVSSPATISIHMR